MGLCYCWPIVDFMCFFFTHTLFPQETDTFDLAGINLTSHGFSDVRSFVYYFNVKFLVISLLSLWFISSIYWWRYAILSGIILNTYQLWEGFQENLMLIDEAEYFYSLPYIFILVTLLVIASQTIKYHSKVLFLYKELCEEIEQFIIDTQDSTGTIGKQREYFSNLKKRITKNGVNLKNFKDLQKLRQELIDEINAGT